MNDEELLANIHNQLVDIKKILAIMAESQTSSQAIRSKIHQLAATNGWLPLGKTKKE